MFGELARRQREDIPFSRFLTMVDLRLDNETRVQQ